MFLAHFHDALFANAGGRLDIQMAAVFYQEFDEMIPAENWDRFRQFHFAKIKCVKLVIRTVYVLHSYT